MKVLAEKRKNGKYFIKLYGIEYEIILPEEKKVLPSKSKKSK